MNKQNLLNAFEHLLNNAIIVLIMKENINPEAWAFNKVRFPVKDGSIDIDISGLCAKMKTSIGKQALLEELEVSIKRMLIRESYDLIFSYTSKTKQLEKYKQASFYPFIQLVRDSSAHNFDHMIFNPRGFRKTDTITWRDRSYDYSMLGQEITISFEEALFLFDEQERFIRTELQ
jgi:hypothetical protein